MAGERQQRQGRFSCPPHSSLLRVMLRSPDPALTREPTSSSPGMVWEQGQRRRGWTHGLLKLTTNRDTGHGHLKAEERLSSCHFNTPVNQSRWKPYALLGSIHLVARETSFLFKMAGKGLQKPASNPHFSGMIRAPPAWQHCAILLPGRAVTA